jgi:hypothetical protein
MQNPWSRWEGMNEREEEVKTKEGRGKNWESKRGLERRKEGRGKRGNKREE